MAFQPGCRLGALLGVIAVAVGSVSAGQVWAEGGAGVTAQAWLWPDHEAASDQTPPLDEVLPGQVVRLVADWQGVPEGEQIIECQFWAAGTKPAVLIRFAFRIDDSGESRLWCTAEIPHDTIAEQITARMLLANGSEIELQLPVRRNLWQAAQARWRRQSGYTVAQQVFDSTELRLQAQRVSNEFISDLRRPGPGAVQVQPGQALYHLGHWQGMDTESAHELRCEARDPSGKLRHVTRFRFQPRVSNWEAWCVHELSVLDRPGAWQFQMFLNGQGYPAVDVELRHNLRSRLLRWLAERPVTVGVPVSRPHI